MLRALHDARVEFVVVGGLAAVLDGAPINIFDLDVVHSRNETNIARLLALLERLDAIYRIQPERRIRPSVSHLNRRGVWIEVRDGAGNTAAPEMLGERRNIFRAFGERWCSKDAAGDSMVKVQAELSLPEPVPQGYDH